MSNDKIVEGDSVVVTITENLYPIEGTVLYTPSATGDAFHIREKETERVWYIQNYLCMYREKR
jgi:hypothetical protein